MKFIHISDIHLTIPGEIIDGLDPHKRFHQALKHIETHHSDAERIIITGDLAHWGECEAYEALNKVIEKFPIPVRLLLGNHDDRDAFIQTNPHHPLDGSGFVNHGEQINDLTFIYCDTNEPQTHAGHFCDKRLAWLEGVLTTRANQCVLFFHHNPRPLRQPAMDSIGLVPAHSTALMYLIRQHSHRIRHIFFGHTHLTASGIFAGVPFACVRSTLHQGIPEFSKSEWLHGANLAPHYSVVFMEGDDTVIHQIPFTYDGPIKLSGTGWKDWAKQENVA